ncbi:hypothetical protein EVAR_6636_1 [Eumeta japonica]|uniref:Uncharacterized protein n=1 Tax=Eumeta variegata TaxID=151549 RepID=A0A4C1TN79_EUMVA|nr:hypothetical protein EVAR_6636_1 [Eumeta japonica]
MARDPNFTPASRTRRQTYNRVRQASRTIFLEDEATASSRQIPTSVSETEVENQLKNYREERKGRIICRPKCIAFVWRLRGGPVHTYKLVDGFGRLNLWGRGGRAWRDTLREGQHEFIAQGERPDHLAAQKLLYQIDGMDLKTQPRRHRTRQVKLRKLYELLDQTAHTCRAPRAAPGHVTNGLYDVLFLKKLSSRVACRITGLRARIMLLNARAVFRTFTF